MRIMAILCALSLLIGGVALMPSSLEAADWISDADSYAASCVPRTGSTIRLYVD